MVERRPPTGTVPPLGERTEFFPLARRRLLLIASLVDRKSLLEGRKFIEWTLITIVGPILFVLVSG